MEVFCFFFFFFFFFFFCFCIGVCCVFFLLKKSIQQKKDHGLHPIVLVGGFDVKSNFFFFFFFFFLPFVFFRAAPMACGGSQARCPIGAVAAGLHHSHSYSGSQSHL